MIYFDNSSTTPIHPLVMETVTKVSENFIGNPSSLHKLGEHAGRLLDQSRIQVAELLGVEKNEIFFTSGGTEGDNWVIKGTAIEKIPYGKHLITTSVEHPAVKESFIQLEKLGFDVTYLPVNEEGVVSAEDVRTAITDETILVSVMSVNNEIGSVQPIEEIGHVLENYPAIHFHVDAVQGIGRVPLTLGKDSRIDFAVFSAHKFHGPKGVGIVYKKHGRVLAPILSGGGQESGLRSGTENVAGIAGTAKALRLQLENTEEKNKHLYELKERLLAILHKHEKITIFTPSQGAPQIICFGIRGIKGEVVVHGLESEGIFVSTTSACSSRKGLTSSTLFAMNIPERIAETSVRISLSPNNTIEEVEKFERVLDKLYGQFERLNTR